jgi:hypothetical protein
MYKDAAILIFEINRICNKYGYELKDAHPYNYWTTENSSHLLQSVTAVKPTIL